MAGHINVKCPNCRTTYRLAAKLAGKRVRCKLCKRAFHVATAEPISASGQNFDDTVLGWLRELDEVERNEVPKPRVISARTVATNEAPATPEPAAREAGGDG